MMKRFLGIAVIAILAAPLVGAQSAAAPDAGTALLNAAIAKTDLGTADTLPYPPAGLL